MKPVGLKMGRTNEKRAFRGNHVFLPLSLNLEVDDAHGEYEHGTNLNSCLRRITDDI